MLYDACSYNITKDDLNTMKAVANEFGFKIGKISDERKTDEIEELSWHRCAYHTVEFEPIEVESYSEGLGIEDRFWVTMLHRSNNRKMLDIVNS